MSNSLETTGLLVKAVRYEAEGVLSYELRRPDGADLPALTAGSHVDLVLPTGLVRSYSISSDPLDRSRYVIGVARDAQSRGGSMWIHDHVRPGDRLEVSAPRNNFELDESAANTVLIAGGIGITPLLSMVRRLVELGTEWTLYFAVRSRSHAAFLEDLEALAAKPDRLQLHVDDENDGAVLDIARIVSDQPAGTHFYCCGPTPMIHAFGAATEALAPDLCHVEHFVNELEPDLEGGFELELEQSGLVLSVKEGKTILETLQEAGVDVPFSCREGICGTCETRVIAGTPDHRDLVLTDQEKASNATMMICCSGSKTPRLVLDR